MADALSRAFLSHPEIIRDGEQGPQVLAVDDVVVEDVRSPTEIATEQFNMLQYQPVKEETLQRIKTSTREDPELKILEQVIKQGWPESKKEVPAQDLKYVAFREELTAQDGIIFKGERVVVPRSLCKEFTMKVHVSHLEIQACLRRAREVWYWPNKNKEITEYISKCQTCKTYSQEQQKEPMIPYPVPSRPWKVIGADLFEFQGRHYLVTTDYYSNFFEVDRLYNTTSKEVICRLKAHLARHGIPDRMVSDNGPQFTSEEFRQFADAYEFQHGTSSPDYPQSNGKSENAVKTAKRIMEKVLAVGADPYLGFLDFRNTPTEGLDTSPVQRLFGRRTKTLLPTSSRLLSMRKNDSSTERKLNDRKRKQMFYYNKASKSLKPLKE
ncbi:Retrovirus-related Pol poly from transposon [Paramuricea clavata]|uniref:Retrovirus-related Pol poly from transposon n=1 Tax=Paramuricea clavata TaxID=317549 RepID=A0A7D9K3P8_PARCT|nr:Retrovirus-related Pol poly from transposon [Paramuricea clavata]